jgi:DNA-binding response OmpR family regulator
MTEIEKQQKIMIVDDTPQNLKLLGNMLREEGYHVYSFPKGEFALKAAERNTPDLILLDINMPGMNGYEVCEKLQEDPVLREIPVIFLSALNEMEDKVKAFSSGGVDYITKPFQFEEVIARIQTHLALRGARQELKDLLNSTVIGSVRAMAELLAITSPQEFGRTLRVARYVRGMVRHRKLPKPWKYEIAALLSNLGYVSLGEKAWKERLQEILDRTPSEQCGESLVLAARIVRCIPRLEDVPEMIMEQRYFPEWHTPWLGWSEPVLGGQILKLANDFDLLAQHFASIFEALRYIQETPQGYNKELLDSLEEIVTAEAKGKSEEVEPRKLRKGMILVQDMLNRQGVKLLPRGTELSEQMLEHIDNWVAVGVVPEKPLLVLIPLRLEQEDPSRRDQAMEELLSPSPE